MLIFQKEYVMFNYVEKSHLKVVMNITNNNSTQYAYFKFKITRPKYYLLKPDKGNIKPKQTIRLQITLHKQGIPQSVNDKIKCFYSFHDNPINSEPEQFDQRSDTQTHKLPIRVNNLPLGFQRVSDNKSSQVKSARRSDADFFQSNLKDTSTLQGQIRQKQAIKSKLLSQISNMRSSLTKEKTPTLKSQSKIGYVVLAAVGFVVGTIGGFFLL